MVKFKRHKEAEECDDCCSQVPLTKVDRHDGKTTYVCVFCYSSIGRGDNVASKAILAQMFNTLFEELKKP